MKNMRSFRMRVRRKRQQQNERASTFPTYAGRARVALRSLRCAMCGDGDTRARRGAEKREGNSQTSPARRVARSRRVDL